MRDDPAVIMLAERARDGDQRAWDQIRWPATTWGECLRVPRAAPSYDLTGSPLESLMSPDHDDAMIEQEILTAELNAALRAAFAELPPRCRRLLSMLLSDPPFPPAKISAAPSIPIGSIGPQRARCLDRLRRSPHLTAFSERETQDKEAEDARISDAGGGQRA